MLQDGKTLEVRPSESQDGSSGCVLRSARPCTNSRSKHFYDSQSTDGVCTSLRDSSTWLCRELEKVKTCYYCKTPMPRYWIYMNYNLYRYLYITRFYSKRSMLQRVQRLRNEQNEVESLRTVSSMIRRGPKASFFFLVNTIVLVGLGMRHPSRTFLPAGYSKIKRSSRN